MWVGDGFERTKQSRTLSTKPYEGFSSFWTSSICISMVWEGVYLSQD